MTSNVADLIIRIKNGYMARRDQIAVPRSKFRIELLRKLQEVGYISSFTESETNARSVTVTLHYENGIPALTDVKLYSKPGRRWYIASNEIPHVRGGLGCAIISTSQGLLTDVEARKKTLGGELLFSIW